LGRPYELGLRGNHNTCKAAKSKGNAELRKLKAEVKGVIAEVKAGTRDRNDATAIFYSGRHNN
jgi:hypothetical protein